MNKETKVDETANFEATISDEAEVKTEDKPAELKVEPDTKPEEKKEEKPSEEDPKEDEKSDKKEKVEEKSSDKTADSDDTTADNKPKGKGIKKRINKLVREREDEKRAREQLERENKELLKRLADKKAPEKESKEPVESDFDTYDEYLDALEAHEKDSSSTEPKPEVQKKTEKTTSDTEANQLSDAQRTAMAVIREKVQDAADKPDDFDAVALAKDVDISAEMLESLAECDDPAKVMYHLGKNKSLATDIAAMTPAQQMREITRLDISVKAKPEKTVKQTKAADPITPVDGSDVQEKNLEDMSFSEYEAERNKATNKKGFW